MKQNHRLGWYRRQLVSSLLTLGIIIVLLLPIQPIHSQTIDFPVDSIIEPFAFGTTKPQQLRSVVLDGRKLFPVASLAQGDTTDALSLGQRVQEIERKIQQVASQGIDPNHLVLEVRIDEATKYPLIYANNQYIMTVTPLDAQAQGLSVLEWAEQVRGILQESLIQYHAERQLEATLSQAVWAGILLLLAIAGNWLIERNLGKLKLQRSLWEQELANLQRLEAETEDTSNDAQEIIQQKASLHSAVRGLADKQQLLRLGQWVLWGSVLTIGLGIFPYTRNWQLLILQFLGGAVFHLMVLIVLTMAVMRFSDYAIDRLFSSLRQSGWYRNQRLSKRINTFSGVIKGVANTAIILTALIFALAIIGISIAPVIASLGFIGLGISLAAQDILKDVFNGLLILLEDQFAEGDVIVVNGKSGQVERMNLRITQLRNTEGALITIPNSSIRTVENLSNGWARVDLGIDVAYDTDLDQAISVIESVAVRMSHERSWRNKIIDPPEVLGVDKFGDNSITIRLWIKVQPLKQWEVAREFRLRLKKAFDQANISIPFPQRELWFRSNLHILTNSHKVKK
jgi:small conductance mechanosensitive channel